MTNINVNLNECPTEYCECGCPFFTRKTIMKRIPAIMVGMGASQDTYNTVDYLACECCGKKHKSVALDVPNWPPVGVAFGSVISDKKGIN